MSSVTVNYFSVRRGRKERGEEDDRLEMRYGKAITEKRAKEVNGRKFI
jgi:hypothetical protein